MTALEQSIRIRINYMRSALAKGRIDLRDDVYAKLDEVSALTDSRLTEARANTAQAQGLFSQRERDAFAALKEEQITDEQIVAVAKKNNLERIVGLNVLNVVGVFLLIIGAITLARFTYYRLTDVMKGIMLFALGGILLAAGEMLNRKKPNVFSLGISAGGIGILYAALATSYFGLRILEMYPALIVCVLITAGAFVLSRHYNAQTIAVFALIGGYLPMYSIGSDAVIAYGAMLYFVALNLLALLLSFSKKWRVTSFIGLALNIVGTCYLCLRFAFDNADSLPARILTILYVLFAFLIYTAIPIISNWRTGAGFRKSDVVLLAINTFFSSLIMYGVFYGFDMDDYTGLLAVFFAVIYLFLGRVIEKKFSGEQRHMGALFYLTGLAFVVLMIPLQFGRVWLSLGWLAEGVFLAAYGVVANEKRIRQAGLTVSLLCLAAFVLYDCRWLGDTLFPYKYLAITLGSLILLGAYMVKRMMSGLFVKVYKYVTLANVWLYSMYVLLKLLGDLLYSLYGYQTAFRIDYLLGAAAVTATFILAFAFSQIRLLADTGVNVLTIALYGIGIVALAVLNTALSPAARAYMRADTPAMAITAGAALVLVAMALLSVLALRQALHILVAERKLGVQWYPLILSGYGVIILTQNLIVQYDLSFASAAISILYGLTAFAWIAFGFLRRYSLIRKFGLGLALLSVIKLFVVDLAVLTQGYRILSYFVLGITLIAISFVYQYFNKRLELREGATVRADKGD